MRYNLQIIREKVKPLGKDLLVFAGLLVLTGSKQSREDLLQHYRNLVK